MKILLHLYITLHNVLEISEVPSEARNLGGVAVECPSSTLYSLS